MKSLGQRSTGNMESVFPIVFNFLDFQTSSFVIGCLFDWHTFANRCLFQSSFPPPEDIKLSMTYLTREHDQSFALLSAEGRFQRGFFPYRLEKRTNVLIVWLVLTIDRV